MRLGFTLSSLLSSHSSLSPLFLTLFLSLLSMQCLCIFVLYYCLALFVLYLLLSSLCHYTHSLTSCNLRIYFTPNRVLSGLALVGLPGTEGKLLVVSESQIEGRDIVLEIPFKLAPCNLGYYNPIATTVEEVCFFHLHSSSISAFSFSFQYR